MSNEFSDGLRRAAEVDPLFAYAQRRWHLSKAHVAKGHEAEKARLTGRGARWGAGIGAVSNAAIGAWMAAGAGPRAAATAAALGAGIGALSGAATGGGFGALEADRRLALSQARGSRGYYRAGPGGRSKTAAGYLGGLARATNTVLGNTATAARAQIQGTGRAMKAAKPPVAKPKVVKTPAPAAPRVEPSTITPTQAPLMKSAAARAGARAALRKHRRRTGTGDPVTGGEPRRPGEDMTMRHLAPSNEPVTHTGGAGGPRDF